MYKFYLVYEGELMEVPPNDILAKKTYSSVSISLMTNELIITFPEYTKQVTANQVSKFDVITDTFNDCLEFNKTFKEKNTT